MQSDHRLKCYSVSLSPPLMRTITHGHETVLNEKSAQSVSGPARWSPNLSTDERRRHCRDIIMQWLADRGH
jgi:hypothetical protein